MVASSGAEADNNADRVSTYAVGMCQKFTRECWEVGSLYGSAIDAWYGARDKHPGDRNPPEGAPTYYGGGQYGHAVVSAGGGRVRSTDAPSSGKVSDQDLSWPERQWGYTYLGWTGDINGVTCPNLGSEPDTGNGDDMPNYDHGATTSNTDLPAGKWINIVFTSESGDNAFTPGKAGVKISGRPYTSVLHVTVTGATEGSTIKMRVVEYDSDGDAVETGGTTEALATPGETAATHAHNGYVSEGRTVRFQALCTVDARLDAADAVVLSWP